MVTNFYFGFFLSFFSIYIIIMRYWPKIIVVILILVTLFILYYYRIKTKSIAPSLSTETEESLALVENFAGDNMCSLTPKLLDVNYVDSTKFETKEIVLTGPNA